MVYSRINLSNQPMFVGAREWGLESILGAVNGLEVSKVRTGRLEFRRFALISQKWTDRTPTSTYHPPFRSTRTQWIVVDHSGFSLALENESFFSV